MKKQKKIDYKSKILTIRLSLSLLLAVAFMLVFFLCGGLTLLLGKVGQEKCFSKEDFEVHFIDVGQGDATFLRFPDNTTMLIDAGPTYTAVCNYLEDIFMQEDINKIDYFVLTHQDADHVGGAVGIFDKFDIVNFYRPMVYSTYEVETFGNKENFTQSNTKAYNDAIISAYQEKCNIEYNFEGVSWGNDDYKVQFLSPNEIKYSSSNAYSPIIRVEYSSKVFLFTGDAEVESEQEVIDKFPKLLDADILKVAHHGSKNGTSAKFLQYVTPEYAIISVGKNSYNHPNEETLARLSEVGSKVYLTLQSGSIAVTVKGGQIVFGGYTNSPTVDLTIIVFVFVLAILTVWGVKPIKVKINDKKDNSSNKK